MLLYNVISYRGGRRKFAIMGVCELCIDIDCVSFSDTMRFPKGMHMGEWLYVMLALFAAHHSV